MNVFQTIYDAFQTASLVHAFIIICSSFFIIKAYLKHRQMVHILCVATSYILLTVITVAAVNWQIFTYPTGRLYGMIFCVFAFMLGDWALFRVWKNRQVPTSVRYKELQAENKELQAENKELKQLLVENNISIRGL